MQQPNPLGSVALIGFMPSEAFPQRAAAFGLPSWPLVQAPGLQGVGSELIGWPSHKVREAAGSSGLCHLIRMCRIQAPKNLNAPVITGVTAGDDRYGEAGAESQSLRTRFRFFLVSGAKVNRSCPSQSIESLFGFPIRHFCPTEYSAHEVARLPEVFRIGGSDLLVAAPPLVFSTCEGFPPTRTSSSIMKSQSFRELQLFFSATD